MGGTRLRLDMTRIRTSGARSPEGANRASCAVARHKSDRTIRALRAKVGGLEPIRFQCGRSPHLAYKQRDCHSSTTYQRCASPGRTSRTLDSVLSLLFFFSHVAYAIVMSSARLAAKEPLKINFPFWSPRSSVRGSTAAGSYFLTSPKLDFVHSCRVTEHLAKVLDQGARDFNDILPWGRHAKSGCGPE